MGKNDFCKKHVKLVLNDKHKFQFSSQKQEPVLRGAAQQNLLNCIISTTKLSSTNNLERVLYTFWSKKVIFVNTAIWDKVENYISEHHNVDNMIAEVKQKMSSLSKNELLPPNLLEKSVISSLMPILIVASNNHQTMTKIISEIISTINDQKPDGNRLYSSNRINKNYEESLRLKYQCLKAIRDIFAFPEKRKGKLYLKFTETPEISSVGVNTLKNIIADKAIALDIQECLSITRYLMAAETVDSIGIVDVYISLFDILPVEFIKGKLFIVLLVAKLLNKLID